MSKNGLGSPFDKYQFKEPLPKAEVEEIRERIRRTYSGTAGWPDMVVLPKAVWFEAGQREFAAIELVEEWD